VLRLPFPRTVTTASKRTRATSAGAGMIALLAATVLAGCSSAGSAGSGSGSVELTLYDGQHPQTTDALVKAFTKETGIAVKVRDGDEEELSQQIQEEGAKSPADVFYTENSPALVQLSEKHLLSPIDSTTLAAVPAKYSSPQGDWVGVTARVSGLVYNTDKLKPSDLPTSVLGLADPKWKGKLDLAPSETDLQPIITSVEIRYGQAATVKWLKALKANAGSHISPDNETLVSNVNRGITQIGIINHYYWYRLRAENGASGMHSALASFAPGDAGYLLDVSGAGVLKSSAHQAEAQKLVAFLVSAAGQRVIAQSDSFEYPLRPGIAANPQLPPLSSYSPTPLSLAALGDGRTAVSLLQEAGLL
jgi:iron(III) transport system substrate-binding protein